MTEVELGIGTIGRVGHGGFSGIQSRESEIRESVERVVVKIY